MAIFPHYTRNPSQQTYSVPNSRTGTNVAPSGTGSIYTVSPPGGTPVAREINPSSSQPGGVNTLAALMALRRSPANAYGVNTQNQYGVNTTPQQYGVNTTMAGRPNQYGVHTASQYGINTAPAGAYRQNAGAYNQPYAMSPVQQPLGAYGINSMPGTLANTMYGVKF